MSREWVSFLLALQFLTRLPIDVGERFTPELFARSVRYYPLVGALIGALGAATYLLSAALLPHAVAVVLALTGLVLLTGAFHEDGLADCFDGIGGGQHREAKLRIMRDSRLGTYGTLALMSSVALRAAALIALPAALVPWILVSAHCLSRQSSVLVISGSTYARDEGTGKPVAQTMDAGANTVALLSSLAVALVAARYMSLDVLLAGLLVLTIAHVVLRRWIERHIDGYTGDTLGAIQQVSEVGFILGCLAWL